MFRKVLLIISLVLLVGLLTACTSEGQLLPELQEPFSFLIQKLIEYLLIPCF